MYIPHSMFYCTLPRPIGQLRLLQYTIAMQILNKNVLKQYSIAHLYTLFIHCVECSFLALM
jgi:hypothetical protein